MGCLVVLEWLFRNFQPVPHGENTPCACHPDAELCEGEDLVTAANDLPLTAAPHAPMARITFDP